MLSRSIENGTMATTRLSTIAVVHVVQPRFEPPQTKNLSIFSLPSSWVPQNEVIVSMARTAALVIGNRAGHLASPVRESLEIATLQWDTAGAEAVILRDKLVCDPWVLHAVADFPGDEIR